MAPSLEELVAAQPISQKMVDFINESKSPYHAVGSLKKRLLESGYEQIYEREANWEQKIKPCGKYFFTRNHSTIVAFAVGGQFNGGNSGLKIIGAHTDSPNLVIKPISSQKSSGYLQVGVQTYGGGLWYSWFDRDLTVAGRVILSDGQGKFKQHLVEVKRPILRIPSLAIHLQREVSTEGFKPNTELHLLPIIATELGEMNDDPNAKGFIASHHSVLLKAIAEELKCDVADIRDFDMSIADVQPGVLGGIHNEFVFAPRLDNLASCFVSLEALINSENTLATEKDIRMICLFDHEEVGSTSANGADSSLINDTINRVIQCTHASFDKNAPVDSYGACIANSFIISCDMAHAVHPNYSEKHQAKHRPQIHQGLVIKTNANQRYASNGHTSFLFGELAKRHNIPIQQFVVRNDSACGSTIGPITSANTSIRTIDVGIPQLSMHSIREQCGCIDIKTTIELFTQYFNEFSEIDAKLNVDE